MNMPQKTYEQVRRDKRRNRVNRIARWVGKQTQPFRQADIARALDIPRTTVWRLLPDLENRGVLLYQCEDGRLCLAPKYLIDVDY